MFDVAALKAFTDPLAWFLTLGKSDTQQMRDEIEDLLHDTRKSIQTLIELEQILASFDKRKFNEKTFYEVYLHCTYTYTGADAPPSKPELIAETLFEMLDALASKQQKYLMSNGDNGRRLINLSLCW